MRSRNTVNWKTLYIKAVDAKYTLSNLTYLNMPVFRYSAKYCSRVKSSIVSCNSLSAQAISLSKRSSSSFPTATLSLIHTAPFSTSIASVRWLSSSDNEGTSIYQGRNYCSHPFTTVNPSVIRPPSVRLPVEQFTEFSFRQESRKTWNRVTCLCAYSATTCVHNN